MEALAILDRQHGDKGGRFDPGASFGELREVELSTGYGRAAERRLRARGISVLWLDAGRYEARHLEAIDAASTVDVPAIYCALHVNATPPGVPPGGYAMAFYDSRSRRGARGARDIAEHLGELREVSSSRARQALPGDWTSNAWHTIRRIYAGPPTLSGVCVEPGFINAPGHASLWTPAGLERIGEALARGIEQFLLGGGR